jgi:hypothetical protein
VADLAFAEETCISIRESAQHVIAGLRAALCRLVRLGCAEERVAGRTHTHRLVPEGEALNEPGSLRE